MCAVEIPNIIKENTAYASSKGFDVYILDESGNKIENVKVSLG
jgi:tRNA pseudouridine-54 N-methylase